MKTNTALIEEIRATGRKVKAASRILATLDADTKNAGLNAMADALESEADTILAANAKDVAAGETAGLTKAMLDRLRLDAKRLGAMASEVRSVAKLPDPVGEILREWDLPNGIHIQKKRVPIGVVGIIYESRPNVTSDAAVLCVKTGNGVMLRGGSEAIYSNQAIVQALRKGTQMAGLPLDSVALIPITDREAVKIMASLDDCIDVIIPRGGHGLIEAVVTHARMPVIKHYDGICHAYVHADADITQATEIVFNAKCQRPGVCNAIETLLVDRSIAQAFLTVCAKRLLDEGVELRGDEETASVLGQAIKPATEEDWRTEYLDKILSIRIVEGLDQAIEHIETYGSHHSDVILTRSSEAAEEFLNRVDSATVYWNASTRFTDGGQFGFGAEIGISTDKLHARGPMGLEELTSYKYLLRGSGQVRS